MSKGSHPDAVKARAEAVFGQAAADPARQAAAAASAAAAEKIARLRALRLKKEESERIAAEVRKARRQMRAP